MGMMDDFLTESFDDFDFDLGDQNDDLGGGTQYTAEELQEAERCLDAATLTNGEFPYDIDEGAFVIAAMESEMTINNMLATVAIEEARYFAEHGTEIVYEALDPTKGPGKVLAFLKDKIDKAWGAIQSLLQKLVKEIRTVWCANGKKFAEKAAKKAQQKNLGNNAAAVITGKKYSVSANVSDGYGVLAKIQDKLNEYKADNTQVKADNGDNKAVKGLLSTLSGITAENAAEFKKEMREKVSGEQDVTGSTTVQFKFKDSINEIASCKTSVKNVLDHQQAMKTIFKGLRAGIDRKAKKADENLAAYAKAIGAAITLLNTGTNGIIDGIKDVYKFNIRLVKTYIAAGSSLENNRQAGNNTVS